MFSSVRTSIWNTYKKQWIYDRPSYHHRPQLNAFRNVAVKRGHTFFKKFEFYYIALLMWLLFSKLKPALFNSSKTLSGYLRLFIFWWGWKTLRAKRNDMRRIMKCVRPFWKQIKRMQMNKFYFQRYSVRDKRNETRKKSWTGFPNFLNYGSVHPIRRVDLLPDRKCSKLVGV